MTTLAATGFAARIEPYRERIDRTLEERLAAGASALPASTLTEAMRYAVLGGGKRLRPLLAYASAELLAVAPEKADAIAAAVEMVHAYSLVHDDLPAMDDDALRRGRPTVHIAFDEATAILVGDALHSLAFEIITDAAVFTSAETAELARQLAAASGGMVVGQALDIAYSGAEVDRDALEFMFSQKTGRLIAACILMPLACAGEQHDRNRALLTRFAGLAGICFQIHDDVLEATRTTEELGKSSESDARNDRSSYPARFGLDAARARAGTLGRDAEDCLRPLGAGAEGLRCLTALLTSRDH